MCSTGDVVILPKMLAAAERARQLRRPGARGDPGDDGQSGTNPLPFRAKATGPDTSRQ